MLPRFSFFAGVCITVEHPAKWDRSLNVAPAHATIQTPFGLRGAVCDGYAETHLAERNDYFVDPRTSAGYFFRRLRPCDRLADPCDFFFADDSFVPADRPGRPFLKISSQPAANFSVEPVCTV